MKQENKRLLSTFIAMAMVLVGSTYLARDYLMGQFVQNVLTYQAQTALKQNVQLSSLLLDSNEGHISLEQLAFSNLDDPPQQQNFAAERIELNARVTGIFSPRVLVKHASVHNSELLLEYVAPGVSNFKMAEQSYRAFVQQRKADGKSRLLEWDLERVEFYKVRFRLIDHDGQQLADVVIPKIVLSSLSSSHRPEDNLALFLRQVQFSLIQETIKGRVTGNYDLNGLLRLTRRELPNSRLLSTEQMELMKKTGRSLLDKLLK